MSPRVSVSRRAFLETLAATGAFGLAASLTDGWIVHAQTAASAPFVPNVFCAIDADRAGEHHGASIGDGAGHPLDAGGGRGR